MIKLKRTKSAIMAIYRFANIHVSWTNERAKSFFLTKRRQYWFAISGRFDKSISACWWFSSTFIRRFFSTGDSIWDQRPHILHVCESIFPRPDIISLKYSMTLVELTVYFCCFGNEKGYNEEYVCATHNDQLDLCRLSAK